MDNEKKITSSPVKIDEEVVQGITKKKRPKSSIVRQATLDDGDNTKYLQHSLEISKLGSIDPKNPVEVEIRVDKYFEICIRNDMKPSIAGLALAVGVSRQMLWEYAKGLTKIPEESVKQFKRAYSIINAQMEDYMQNGKINPVSGIFLMKNNMGYHDQQEYILTPNTAPESSAEELIKEAKQLPDITDD